MRIWIIVGVVVTALVGTTVGFTMMRMVGPQETDASQGVAVPNIGGPFALVDHTGEARTQDDFKGKPMLIYFGYTFCPDVCPAEVAKMVRAVDLLGDDGEAVQPVFITIDPERDTVEHLANYVDLFHPRLVGLTGDETAIADVAHQYKVYYAKVESEEFTEYLMDHSSFFYLMDANGDNAAVFPMRSTPEDIADAVRAHLSNTGALS